jgi:hypothetical protein
MPVHVQDPAKWVSPKRCSIFIEMNIEKIRSDGSNDWSVTMNSWKIKIRLNKKFDKIRNIALETSNNVNHALRAGTRMVGMPVSLTGLERPQKTTPDFL